MRLIFVSDRLGRLLNSRPAAEAIIALISEGELDRDRPRCAATRDTDIAQAAVT
jgi:hypothetical protein